MFAACADPKAIEGLTWALCYLTSGKHLDFYWSFLVVLALLAITAPAALAFGFGGATAARSGFLPARWLGKVYIAMVRGVPDIIFFLFFVIALDQAVEWTKHQIVCPDAKVPHSSSAAIWHQAYGFFLAAMTFALVVGAFVANVLYGAMQAVPRAELETGEAYGMSSAQVFRRILVPQMWVYALPGLSNLWMILIKATPLLFLLGIKDVVFYARELGSTKTQVFDYPHGDWRLYYFLGLLVFYLALTRLSEIVLNRLSSRISRGQATAAGDALRRAGA